MDIIHCAPLLCVVVCIGMFLCTSCVDEFGDSTAVYIVTLKEPPSSTNYYAQLRQNTTSSRLATSGGLSIHKPRNISRKHGRYRSYIARVHDSLLKRVLKGEKYLKLYSYHFLINGFAVFVTEEQATKLSKRREVANVVMDFSVRTATTHTPQFLGLPQGAWSQDGGYESAGAEIVIGFVDTGIDPTHPSFADDLTDNPFPIPAHFSGICEVTPDFPSGSCNRKLVGARHFAASAITRGIFNASQDYASPFDVDGHGTHTASIAAGNHGIPVVVAGHHFGNASGMAPRSHIAVYKALYKSFGGFAADVVAGVDQAAEDGVDIISLSITPNRRPPGIATFFNPIDMALLSAVKAGIFVVQAAGNTGPAPKSMSSFSPWIFTVGAASHDRTYANSITLGNNVIIPGVGLAPGTYNGTKYKLIAAMHALKNGTHVSEDMYVSECQDSSNFDRDLIKGKLLICSYSIRFVLGLSTVKQASQIAKNLSAAGVIFYMDSFVLSFRLNPTPMRVPGIIISSPEDSKILLHYYNSSLEVNGLTKRISKFGAVGSISGGLKANYISTAPQIMYYSARGPDPEDSSVEDSDIMKPNLVAPGNFIWAAWSSVATDSVEFLGENFAMMSGTSMAAPHIAGLASLIKQKYPTLSPSAIASALSTTASLYDKTGGPIMAQRAYANPEQNRSPATPFDMGSGFVNATAALDPGLIFDSSYDDYMSFLCGINGSFPVVFNYTAENCGLYNSSIKGADLNLPSVTIAKLNQSRVVLRTVTNIAGPEFYRVGWTAPYGISLKVFPTRFSIDSGKKQELTIFFNATMNSSTASFGRIGLFGSAGHTINIPLSVIWKFSYYTTK
ncbi:subtilisin-like protease SBT2.3 isoform X1 [Cucurbita maxima]|uniref:Subtilisin-like protease SBT2.3 isoform X1 n=1 Tax=Cucurbita maxima TaxID=3661 RepID=A0A6J1KS62_CUCMA|nr:subtilisin-like protease SBT2.3 isoform X1 [Cucurbita maxima]